MVNTLTLNSLTDRAGYSAHFMDPTLWEPYIRRVCQSHGLVCQKISPGVPGTFPTFIVEVNHQVIQRPAGSIVVKFYSHLFNGEASFHIERDLGSWLTGQSLSIPSPGVIAEGLLNPDWRYLIFKHVAGVSIGQVRDKLTKDDWSSVARSLGEYVHRLHALTVDHNPELPISIKPSLEGYVSFLEQQRLICHVNHNTWNDLPAHLLDQLEDFVLTVEHLVDFSAHPYLIHADLTADHLLGRLENGRWRTLSVIDWGDAMSGNLLYELVALHLDLFQSDKQLLRTFLDAYGLPSFYQWDLPRKAFSMVLLNQFPMPAQVYQPHRDARTLHDLAERLFAV